MSLQPRTAAPGKARRAASAGKPRTKKNAAKSTKSTFNPIDKEVRPDARTGKKEAPKTTRRYSDGPKGTPTRKEERNLERSKLRAKRYQEKIAPKAKTTSRADEFVAKRTERAERPACSAQKKQSAHLRKLNTAPVNTRRQLLRRQIRNQSSKNRLQAI
jgi:hypothetical protein